MIGLGLWNSWCWHKYRTTAAKAFGTYEVDPEKPYKYETRFAQVCTLCGKIRVKKVKGAWELKKNETE